MAFFSNLLSVKQTSSSAGGQTILVVGGAGYIGSHMVQDLLRAGYEVVTLDNLCRGHRELVPGGIFLEGDLGDAALLDQIFSRHSVTAVMHFAAFSLVGESVEKPLLYYRNNVSRTIELLDAMRRNARFSLHLTHTDGPLPHAKEIRVQVGGLLGLQKLLHPDRAQEDTIVNIHGLACEAIERYAQIENLPYDLIVQTIVSFEGRRKRTRPVK